VRLNRLLFARSCSEPKQVPKSLSVLHSPPRTVQQGMRRLLGFQIGVTTSIAIVTSSQVIR
jgi:hypothetical protein